MAAAAAGSSAQVFGRPAVLVRQVATQLSVEQAERLEELAKGRQLSVSSIVREAIREYLAAAPSTVVAAR